MRHLMVNGGCLSAGAFLCFLKLTRICSLKSSRNKEVNYDSQM